MSDPENQPPFPEPEAGNEDASQRPDFSLGSPPALAAWPPTETPSGALAVPEDLRTPWSWPDLILFLIFVFGSGIVLSLLASGVVALAWHLPPAEIEKTSNLRVAVLTVAQVLWSAATLAYLYGAVRLRGAKSFWRAIGWRALRPQMMTRRGVTLVCFVGGIGLALAIQLSSAVVGKKAKLPIEEYFHDRWSVLMLMALGILVAPLIEETIFRGYVYPVLARGLGVSGGVTITGALFGLMHAAQLWGGWGQIVLLVIVGIVLTWVRARTGTVLASYFVHLAYNTTLFGGFFLVTGGLRHLPGNS